MDIMEVVLEPAGDLQVIVGQAHFIKTVEDLYEALVSAVPGLKFGVAFCEASGKALVRFDGSEPELAKCAADFAIRIGAGHSFVVVLEGAYPINVLNRIKSLDEVATVFCATSNPVTVVVGVSGQGRGVLGVIDGGSPKGKEGESEKAERHELLRKIGYKR